VPTVHGSVDHGAPRRVCNALQLRPQQGRDLHPAVESLTNAVHDAAAVHPIGAVGDAIALTFAALQQPQLLSGLPPCVMCSARVRCGSRGEAS